jgi:hypothetical protein
VQGRDGEALRELAGLGAGDTHAIHDLLPTALAEMNVPMPDELVADAEVIFDDLASRLLAGELGERWVSQQVDEVVSRSDYSSAVLDLPLGSLYDVDDCWATGWGPPEAELKAMVRDACVQQAHHGMAASSMDDA